MKTKIIYIILAAISFCGCQKVEDKSSQEDNVIKLSFGHPSTTKATKTGFVNGDKVGIYMSEYHNNAPQPLQISGNYVNNTLATYDGATWVVNRPIYQSDNAMDVFAYYPFQERPSSITNFRFEIQTNQNATPNPGQLDPMAASDFLWASSKAVAPNAQNVALNFKHRMSKVIVKVVKGEKYEGELPGDMIVKLHSTVPVAEVDMANGMPAKDPMAAAKTITCKKMSLSEFNAIVVPQNIPSIRPFVEVITMGVSYLVESTFIFRPGVQYTYTLTVNASPGKILIDIGGQIDNSWQ